MSLVVTCERDAGAFVRLHAEWRALEERVHPRTPFITPEWNALWWQHMRRRGLLADQLRLYVVRDADGTLVGIAPMMLTRLPGRGPLALRELQFIGADPNMTELRGPTCMAADRAAVLAAVRARALADGGWDWARWSGVAAGDAPAVPGLPALGEAREVPLMMLDVGSDWEAFRSALPRNIKESLRKCYNAPARDGHAPELHVVTGGAEMAPAVELLLTLHGARAQAEVAVRHADVFAQPRARAFLHAWCEAMAARGALRLFQVRMGGQVVATRVGYAYGNELYLYYSGYDPAWGRYSVMTTVVAEALRWAAGNGFPVVCLSTGRDVSKTRWRPVEMPFNEGVELASGLRARLGYRLLRSLKRAPSGTAAPEKGGTEKAGTDKAGADKVAAG